MPKVKFLQDYKNGMIGVDVAAEGVAELTDEQLAYVLTDVRNPKEAIEVLKSEKPKSAKAGKGAEGDEG
ncbi:MAG: hypothetical protein ACRDHG_13290 [Anaerolineales bacterium]